jgi:hypothetical protein
MKLINPALDAIGWMFVSHLLDNPILVVGTGRSGTSVLLQALGKHPQILSLPGEAPFLTSIGGEAWLFEGSDAQEYYRASLKMELAEVYNELKEFGFRMAAGKHYGLKYVLNNLIKNREWPWKKRFWCAKSFPPESAAQGLISVYPGIRFIYIVRNGADVVSSMVKYKGFSFKPFEAHCEAWSAGVRKYKFFENYDLAIKIRQEDLVENPELCLSRIQKFLGIRESAEPANYIKTTVIHPMDEPSRAVGDIKAFMQKRTPGYENWTEEQRSIFKAICGSAMAAEGYALPF